MKNQINEIVADMDLFLKVKGLEGCSDQTIGYYKRTVKCFCDHLDKLVTDVTADEIRDYLADYRIDEFLRALEYNGYEIKRGKFISVKGKEQKNFLRLRSLGSGYTEKDIEKRIAGEGIEDVSGGLCKAVSDQVTKEKTDQKLDVVLDSRKMMKKRDKV